METFIRDPRRAPDRPAPNVSARREAKSPTRKHRFARATIGFWFGGVLLWTGGCILGYCMPYHHPVAVVISTLWWGVYLGCLGGSVGALIAWLTERAPAAPSRGSDGAPAPPGGADSRAFPARAHGIVTPDQAGFRTLLDGARK
jgi:hypothetical protein